MARVLIYPLTFYVAQDPNGMVMMKSYDEQQVIDWCKENGVEYQVKAN